MIDPVLGQMDHNNNGYVEYDEYRTSEVAENRKSDYPDGKPQNTKVLKIDVNFLKNKTDGLQKNFVFFFLFEKSLE